MSESRARILGGIRRSLGRGALDDTRAAELEARLAAPRANLIPARARIPHTDQVELFVAQAEAVASEVTRVPAPADVPAAVADYLARHNIAPKIRMAPDPALDAIPWDRKPLLEIERGRAENDDRVSVTPAIAGIAETGTLMMVSGPETPTTLNFMPENHIVVLRASQVIGTYEDGWARLRGDGSGGSGRWPGGIPRTVNFITGPSRTADIEQKLYMGAHGPRRLHIVLIDDDGEN